NVPENGHHTFEEIKRELVKGPVLHHVDYSLPFLLRTDASGYGVGGVLLQIDHEGRERTVRYIAKTFTEAERKWSTNEKECYAIRYCLEKIKDTCFGLPIRIQTDHRNLQFMKKSVTPKIARWYLFMQQFDYSIEHIAGANNEVADALSRVGHVRRIEITDERVAEVIEAQKDLSQHIRKKSELEEGILVDEEGLIPIPDDKIELKGKIIRDHHNSVVGHGGLAATCYKIKSTGYTWPSMYADVKQHIKVCAICQKVKEKKIPPAPVLSITMETPFHTVFVDTLTVSADEEKEKYVIVMLDSFTRWCELIPVESLERIPACDAMLPFLARHGIPKVIHTDGGSQFANYLADHLWDTLGVKHHISIAHHPTGNGAVERVNKEIKKHLRGLFLDLMLENKWTVYVPVVQSIINNTFHKSIGCTPFEMLRGIRPSRVLQGRFSKECDKSEAEMPASRKSEIDYVRELVNKLEQLHRRSVIIQRRIIEKREGDEPEVAIGSYVLKKRVIPEGKLYVDLMGPYVVVEKLGDRLYLLRSIVNIEEEEKVHVNDIMPFQEDPTRSLEEMRALAARDYGWTLISEILEHKREQGKLFLKVRWKGWSKTSETWQAYEELKGLAKVKEYIKKKRLRKL
ncbi:DDE-type integrase/transposase/recombinase, partial [Aduncisulcus paluster]